MSAETFKILAGKFIDLAKKNARRAQRPTDILQKRDGPATQVGCGAIALWAGRQLPVRYASRPMMEGNQAMSSSVYVVRPLPKRPS